MHTLESYSSADAILQNSEIRLLRLDFLVFDLKYILTNLIWTSAINISPGWWRGTCWYRAKF